MTGVPQYAPPSQKPSRVLLAKRARRRGAALGTAPTCEILRGVDGVLVGAVEVVGDRCGELWERDQANAAPPVLAYVTAASPEAFIPSPTRPAVMAAMVKSSRAAVPVIGVVHIQPQDQGRWDGSETRNNGGSRDQFPRPGDPLPDSNASDQRNPTASPSEIDVSRLAMVVSPGADE